MRSYKRLDAIVLEEIELSKGREGGEEGNSSGRTVTAYEIRSSFIDGDLYKNAVRI
mgnify:CR=1 FL=1